MRIGIVCFPSLGGSAVVASELANGLADRGHDVHLLASAMPGRVRGGERLSFHPIAVPDYPIFEHAPYTLALASKIVEVARAHRLDLVHVHYAVPHAASAYLARQVLGAAAPRIVVSLHGTDVTRVGADPAYQSVTSFAVVAADGITTPSEFLRREAHRGLGVPDGVPVEVIPNFVDTERFAPAAPRERERLHALFAHRHAADGPVLFHVSNLRPVKRVSDLLAVLGELRRHVPARLVVVGDGPERGAAERQAARLGVSSDVCFLGKRADFADYLRHADGFVLPSESESFGVAALEALAAGVPVFAYHVGGLPEVVAEGTGRLVTPFDVAALARAVLDVVGNPAVQEAHARAARAHAVARFRREPALDRYERYFRRVLAGGSESA